MDLFTDADRRVERAIYVCTSVLVVLIGAMWFGFSGPLNSMARQLSSIAADAVVTRIDADLAQRDVSELQFYVKKATDSDGFVQVRVR